LTTWAARARFTSSTALLSSNSAWARMMPSWLFSRWNNRRRSASGWTASFWGSCIGDETFTLTSCGLGLACHRRLWRLGAATGVGRGAPQRVGEDSDRTAGRAHVLHLAGGNPVVDRPPADPDGLARLHD